MAKNPFPIHTLVFMLLALAIGGCSIKPPRLPVAHVEGAPSPFRIGQIVHVETGKALSFETLMDKLGSSELIFVGEVHDNPEHHLLEVQILQGLMARYGPVAVAMEFFPWPKQPVIDRYLQGDSTEEAFLEEVEWHKQWGYGYRFYRPLILLAKQGGGKVLALNAPNKIVRKVARSGLGSLEPDERRQLAEDIRLENERHRAYLADVFKRHSHRDLKRFEFFYQAQCAWEDTMAQEIARYLRDHKEKMVVFAGNGHIVDRFGIPERTGERIPVTMATVVLYPLTGPVKISREAADYIWFTGHCSQRPFPAHPRGHPKVERHFEKMGSAGDR